MPRELNPELFGPRKQTLPTSHALPSQNTMPHHHSAHSAAPAGGGFTNSHGHAGGNASQSAVQQAILNHPAVSYQQPQMQMPTAPAVHEFEMSEQYRRKIRDLENQVAVLSQKVEKLSSVLDQRFTTLSQTEKAFEQQVKERFEEMSASQAAAVSKLTERRVADVKIQEMIDRHNQLVLNFETRMNQIHKVASEQEMKVMTYQATIDEILREIRNSRR